MTRPSLRELFDRARTYLDTDDLNFPDDLCNMLTRRIWYQAVVMEREWRFFQRLGNADVVAGESYVPMTFDTASVLLPGTRLMAVMWNAKPLVWREASMLLREYMREGLGEPVYWTEINDGLDRNLALFPTPSVDGRVTVEFYQEPVYPEDAAPDPLAPYTQGFVDLPPEFDDALLEGLLGEMYMREEDPDLYDMHRQTFLEQMGSIRNRWRYSSTIPMVIAGRAREPGKDPGGFNADGKFTQPVAPG
jgi:hypothetical protein